MNKNNLILSLEITDPDILVCYLQMYCNLSKTNPVITVVDLDLFNLKLNNSSWDVVTIDLRHLFFNRISVADLENFVSNVKNKQTKRQFIVAIAKDEYQKILAQSVGILEKYIILEKDISDFPVEKLDFQISNIKKIVSNHYDVPEGEIFNKTRKRKIVLPRQIVMYLAQVFTRNRLVDIADYCQSRNHTTAMHAYDCVQNLRSTDKNFNSDILFVANKVIRNYS